MLCLWQARPHSERLLFKEQGACCGLYCAVLTEYRIKGEMRKAGWFSQERSVKEREGVWWNVVVVTPDQWLRTKRLY